MALPRVALRGFYLLVAVLLVLGPPAARASLVRPNAIDRHVDAISSASLLHQPATSLLEPDRQVAAARLARWTLAGRLIAILAQALLLAYFWRSGSAARLRDWMRRRFRSEWLVRFGFGAALGLVAKVASTAPDFYLYRVDRVMGITNELVRAWAATWVLDAVLSMLAVGLVVAFVLWLVAKTHQWYIYTMASVLFVSVVVAYLSPYTAGREVAFERVADVGLAQRVAQLEGRSGLAGLPIVVEERPERAPLETGTVQGLGPSQRIVLPAALLASGTGNEIRFVVAYEIGLVEENAPLRRVLYDAVLVVFGIALAVFIADRIGFRRDDDELSRIALVGALLACAYLIVLPIDHAVQRNMTRNADGYAVSITGDRSAAIRTIVRSSEQRMTIACPDVLTRMFLDRNPPVGERVAALNGLPNNCP